MLRRLLWVVTRTRRRLDDAMTWLVGIELAIAQALVRRDNEDLLRDVAEDVAAGNCVVCRRKPSEGAIPLCHRCSDHMARVSGTARA